MTIKIKLKEVEFELSEQDKLNLLKQLNVKINVKELVKKKLLEMLEKYKSNVRFIRQDNKETNYSTSRFEILNEDNKWLFDIDYDEKNKHFWYSYDRIYKFFTNKYGIEYNDLQEVIESILNEHLNLKGVIPFPV